MKIKTIKEIPEIKGKKIFLRVDFNVPIKDKKIQDDSRIKQSIPTIKYLQEKGAKLIIASHLGRPKGEIKEELRLDKVATRLSELMGISIKKLDEVISDNVRKEVENMKEGEIIVLENIRFKAEEETNDENFSKELAELVDIYVNDAFGTAHRKHASTFGIAKHLPAYGGLLIEKELEALSPLIEKEPARPLTMILGGAKIDTKIGVIRNFIDKVDYLLLGGGLANTFLYALGHDIGESLCEKDKVEVAKEIITEFEKQNAKLIFPTDVIVATELSNEADASELSIEDVSGDMKILDIGKDSTEKYCEIIKKSGTVIWNGPVGVYEFEPFKGGTEKIAKCIANNEANSIIGGGDTADAIKKLGFDEKSFTHISTGGGACIEFLEGKVLPGIQAIALS